MSQNKTKSSESLWMPGERDALAYMFEKTRHNVDRRERDLDSAIGDAASSFDLVTPFDYLGARNDNLAKLAAAKTKAELVAHKVATYPDLIADVKSADAFYAVTPEAHAGGPDLTIGSLALVGEIKTVEVRHISRPAQEIIVRHGSGAVQVA